MIDELDEYDLPFTEVEQRVQDWVKEALDLRFKDAGDPEGPLNALEYDTMPTVMNALLLRVRQRSDRVDQLLMNVTRARARAKRVKATAIFNAEIAYDTAMQANANKRTREFVTAAERNADAALDSLTQKRVAHHAQRAVDVTEEAYEVIKGVHWQLDAIRKDLRAAIHQLQFEAGLER